MNCLPIDTVSAIYACSNTLRIHYHTVEHQDFHKLCRAVTLFERSLGDTAKDEYWTSFLRWLKRYRFLMLAAPLPFNWVDPGFPALEQHVKQHIARCGALYPQFKTEADALLHLYDNLICSTNNPLLQRLVDVWRRLPNGSTGILVKESRLIPAVEAAVKPYRIDMQKHMEVFAPTQIDYAQYYQHLFVIGSAHWFPDHVSTAPRATNIHSLAYRWLGNNWKIQPVFVNSPARSSTLNYQNTPKLAVETKISCLDEHQALLNPLEILPSVNASVLSHCLAQITLNTDPFQEDVAARLLVLAEDKVVFVEADDQTKILIINVGGVHNDEAQGLVQRVHTNDLQVGMFILLRTEGGGDYILPVADKLMGLEVAQRVRGGQMHWKSLLRKIVLQRGLFETCLELIDLGAQRANEINVRNWMAARTIRPSDQDAFRAILRLTGLEHHFDTYWENTEIILRAHRQAGFHIRKQLLNQVRDTDLFALRKCGWMKFVLPEADGGSLVAFRIEQIDPNAVQIPATRLGELLPLEQSLWL